MRVEVTQSAQDEIHGLPMIIRMRIQSLLVRLRAWPAVSGAKPLRGELVSNYRIRTGDYRLVFHIVEKYDDESEQMIKVVEVWKVGNRKDVYLD